MTSPVSTGAGEREAAPHSTQHDKVIAALNPGEQAGYAVDALLHLLEIAAWELCNQISFGEPAPALAIELASTIDRTIELARKQHTIELEAITDAAFHLVPRNSNAV